MADVDIVCNSFARVSKARLIYFAIVWSSSPTVRLNTYCDINLCHFQSSADVADCIVIRRCMLCNHCIMRRYSRSSCIESAILRVGVNIVIFHRTQRISREQAFNRYLSTDFCWQSQSCAIILLAETVNRNCCLFLIEQSKGQSISSCVISDRIFAAGFCTLIECSNYCFVQLPSGDWCTLQNESTANLHYFSM